jgi:hypothetical protein
MLLATATATAALAIGAPGALAATAGDGSHDDSSYSREHDKESKHDKPNGGVHTGGGALTTVRGEDSSGNDSGSDHGKSDSSDSGQGKKGDSSDSGQGKKGGGSDHGKGNSDSDSDSDSGYGSGSGSGSGSKHGHGRPRGGVHTGGGALSAVRSDDWNKDDEKFDPETYRDKNKDDSGSDRGRDDSDSERDKPRGGLHTGGGALATPGTKAGGLAVLGLAGAGAYFLLRRKRAADGLS